MIAAAGGSLEMKGSDCSLGSARRFFPHDQDSINATHYSEPSNRSNCMTIVGYITQRGPGDIRGIDRTLNCVPQTWERDRIHL